MKSPNHDLLDQTGVDVGKVRWREHEFILVTILTAIKLASYVWSMINLTAEEMESLYAVHYIRNGIDFNYYRNILLPQMASVLSLYIGYVWLSRITYPWIRRLWLHKTTGMFAASIGWIAFQFIAVAYLLALAANVATYYAHPHIINYGPGFRFLALFGYNDQALTDLFAGFGQGIGIVVQYLVYACIREGALYFIERSVPGRSYRILVINQFTALFVAYVSIGASIGVFSTIDHTYLAVYFFLIPSILLVYLSNTYWLFPLKGNIVTRAGSFMLISINSRIIGHLVLSTIIITLPFAIFYVKAVYQANFVVVFLGIWAFQLLIVTPASWLMYQQRKDKIQQLRGVEEALHKSNADLQFLRSQINPHFLFNALNALYGTALLEKSERTAEGIQKLGDMMRFMLHENNLDFIPLAREIDYLKNYISLQKLRTQSSAQIMIEDYIDERHCDHSIAPMLLIPFVENAFKHGIRLTKKSWITIKLDCDAQHIRFEVRNSLHPRQENDPEKNTSGIGLNNVVERLKLLYPNRHTFHVGGDRQEFVVQLTIQPKPQAQMVNASKR